jgi:hypothetical protein
VLPTFNLLLAALLVGIGYGRTAPAGLRPPVLELNISFWINAPCVVVQNTIEAFCRKLEFEFNVGYPHPIIFLLVFFVAVGTVWFAVGQRLDEILSTTPKDSPRRLLWRAFADVLFLSLGVVTSFGLFDPKAPHFHDRSWQGCVHDALFVFWGVFLVGAFGVDLVRLLLGRWAGSLRRDVK